VRKLIVLWAALFLAAHVLYFPQSLDDLESINLALAVRALDVTSHQPDPPGAPLFVGAARLATAALFRAGDARNVPHGLALVNAFGAALALVALFWLARVLEYTPRRALAAALVAGTIPLYWFSASRPIADLAALALIVAAQAALARAWIAGGRWHIAAGGLLAGAALGFRVQSAVLTFPLLLAALSRREPAAWRQRAIGIAGVAAGLASWLVPVLMHTAPLVYLRALVQQVDAELRGVESLASHPSARLLLDALVETFAGPFGSWILAAIVLAAAGAGLAIALVREPRVVKTLAIAYLPYLAFHLLFQDTFTDRLALPLMMPIGLLFVVPFAYVSARLMLPAAAGAATAGLFIAMPALHAYARSESPGFGVIRDLHRLPRVRETVLAMHESIAASLQRFQAWEAIPPMRTLPATVDYEWYELVKLWQEGYDGPIWFLADPRRTDLRLIDPAHRMLLRQYGWNSRDVPFLGGARPNQIDWYFIQRPGWFLGRGWALSPEIGGLTARDRMRPGQQPAVAWVRRRPGPVTMILGGRHLGAAGGPVMNVRVAVDGTPVDEWPVAPGPFLFMRPVLPEELAGDGTFARLEVSATWAGQGPAPIELEQFDLQSIDGAMAAYDQGWWEPEYNPRTGQTWRWTSRESTLWLYNPGRDLTLWISGEGPARYYGGPIEMTVLAGEQEIGRFTLDGDFTESLVVPAEPLSVSHGRVTLRVSQTHVPALRGRSSDQRELGVKIYNVIAR
jgi:hypothetical protein